MTKSAASSEREPVPARQDDDLDAAARARLDSASLLQGGRWVEIRHNGEIYRLQSTRLGKLILTK